MLQIAEFHGTSFYFFFQTTDYRLALQLHLANLTRIIHDKKLAGLWCKTGSTNFLASALRSVKASSGRAFGEYELTDAKSVKLHKCKVCYCQSPNLIKSRDKF